MALSKLIQAGPVAITIAEEAGQVSVQVAVDASLGGGAAAGVLKGKAAIEVDLGAQQVADLALGLLAAKFPSMAGIIDGAKAAIDAELAHL